MSYHTGHLGVIIYAYMYECFLYTYTLTHIVRERERETERERERERERLGGERMYIAIMFLISKTSFWFYDCSFYITPYSD
jgi:hypothetical protein